MSATSCTGDGMSLRRLVSVVKGFVLQNKRTLHSLLDRNLGTPCIGGIRFKMAVFQIQFLLLGTRCKCYLREEKKPQPKKIL